MGKSTNNREKQRRKRGCKRKRAICSKNGGDAFDNGYTKADFDVWAEERKRDKRVLSKWGKGFFTTKKPNTRVTMSKDKEVREPIQDPAVDTLQHSINLPLSETTTIINAEGKALVYSIEEEGVDYNASSDEYGTERKPHDLADSPLAESTEAPPANPGKRWELKQKSKSALPRRCQSNQQSQRQ
jgi:hypothetical protein